MLLPGDTRSINISFNIPENWGGEKRVRVEVANIQYISPTALNEYGDSEDDFNVLGYHIPEDDTPTASLSIFSGADADTSNLATGEVKKRGTDDSKTSIIPKTGDSTRTSVALAALGAAASGFVAYSTRRSAIEGGEFENGSSADID